MTGPTDLTPQQDAVRRLLADARHDEPTPPEVVADLARTLAGLQAERDAAAAEGGAPVVDLGARRRRLVGAGVLAAAAVVVTGVALGQVFPQGSSDSGGSDSAASAEDRGSMDSRAGGAEAESSSPEELSGKAAAPQEIPEISLDGDLGSTLSSLRSTSRSPSSALSGDTLVACQVGEVGRGRQVLVQVDGQPGLVVFRFRSPRRSGQETDVYLCGDAEPVRTLTLPAR